MILRPLASLIVLAALSPAVAATPGPQERAAALRILVDRASPARPRATTAADGAEVHRAGDGLFYVDAMVNGATVRFLIDTGATSIVLTPEDARRAGIAVAGSAHLAETANGRTAFTHVMLTELMVGSVADRHVPALVASDRLPVSLLGQSWLQQLASMTIEGDRMLLR